MVKTFISIICVIAIISASAIYENIFVQNQFQDFNEVLEILYEKVDNESAVEDDVIAVQENWLKKKQALHIFIPHNDIKEVDLWISEAITLVRDKEWKDAISKVQVLRNLATQIPMSFVIRIENIL